MEDKEFSHDWEKGEHVFVSGFGKKNKDGSFPLPIGNTTIEDVQIALKLQYWLDKSLVNVRGEPLLDFPSGSLIIDNNVTPIDLSQPIGETTVSLSQDTLQMLDDDNKLAARKEKLQSN